MNDAIVSAMRHTIDCYTALVLSTGHLSDDDKTTLNYLQHTTNMIMTRDTGWFVKLYEFDDSQLDIQRQLALNYPQSSLSLQKILSCAYLSGYRLIEFDADGTELAQLPLYE